MRVTIVLLALAAIFIEPARGQAPSETFRTRTATLEPRVAGPIAVLSHDDAAGASTSVFELSTLSYTDTFTIG